MAETSPAHPTAPLAKGIVKTVVHCVHFNFTFQVISGDTLVVRGVPKGGPPPEKTISIAGITTPRMGRRPGDVDHEVKVCYGFLFYLMKNYLLANHLLFKFILSLFILQDEPYGWEARELLRSKVIGKEVMFSVEYKVSTGREFVKLYLPSGSLCYH